MINKIEKKKDIYDGPNLIRVKWCFEFLYGISYHLKNIKVLLRFSLIEPTKAKWVAVVKNWFHIYKTRWEFWMTEAVANHKGGRHFL